MSPSNIRMLLSRCVKHRWSYRFIPLQSACFSKVLVEPLFERTPCVFQAAQSPWMSAHQPVRELCTPRVDSQQDTDLLTGEMAVKTLLRNISGQFERADIPESDIVAEYIVARVLGMKRLSEFSRVDKSRLLTAEEVDEINFLAKQKLLRVPLQYIVGEWEFRDLNLKMRPPVFIPRPETEMLVDVVTSHYPEDGTWKFLEVGCGSGAISLSLLEEFHQAHVTAIDGSKDAVELTNENAESLGLSDRLEVLNTLLTDDKIPEVIMQHSERYDAIISNPPYVFSEDMTDLDPEISRYEDHRALEGGQDGLKVVKNVIQHARFLLKPEGCIWLETDIRHHKMIQDWLGDHPETCIHFRSGFLDFNDRPRFCQLQYVPSGYTDCR